MERYYEVVWTLCDACKAIEKHKLLKLQLELMPVFYASNEIGLIYDV